MKILSSALIAAALFAVSAHSDRLFSPLGADAPQVMRLTASDPVVQQTMPGECCNDDFRQALPLWESPIDSAIAKP